MTTFSRRPLLLAPVLLLSSCSLLPGKDRKGTGKTTKDIDKAAQTDPEPVLSRTAGIPAASEFLWWSGTMGGGAPGPSTYWVDAFVNVDEQQTAQWRELCDPEADAAAPEVVEDLTAELPVDDYTECPELASQLSDGAWECRVWLSRTHPSIVLALVGEG